MHRKEAKLPKIENENHLNVCMQEKIKQIRAFRVSFPNLLIKIMKIWNPKRYHDRFQT